MNAEMLRQLQTVAERLTPLGTEFAFLGGAVLGLLINDPAAAPVRPTKDVDVLVGTMNRSAHTNLEERLRQAGFMHDMSEGAPLCRWRLDEITVDILPVTRNVFGWKSQWFVEALSHAQDILVDNAGKVRVVTAPFLLATKLEAFKGRGNSDWYGSQDLEDMIALLDGRSGLVEEIVASPAAIKRYLASEFAKMMECREFLDALPGHLPPDPASQRRQPVILDRLRQIVSIADAAPAPPSTGKH